MHAPDVGPTGPAKHTPCPQSEPVRKAELAGREREGEIVRQPHLAIEALDILSPVEDVDGPQRLSLRESVIDLGRGQGPGKLQVALLIRGGGGHPAALSG